MEDFKFISYIDYLTPFSTTRDVADIDNVLKVNEDDPVITKYSESSTFNTIVEVAVPSIPKVYTDTMVIETKKNENNGLFYIDKVIVSFASSSPSVTHYQLGFIENRDEIIMTDVKNETYNDQPFFTFKTDLLKSYNTSYIYQTSLDINRLAFFVFSYNDDIRCDFPTQYCEIVTSDGTLNIRTYYVKYTKYMTDTGDIYYVYDDKKDTELDEIISQNTF